jgi:hypothetical protein
MSTTLLTILTLVEIVALVVVLALFLHLLAGRLRAIAEKLAILGSEVSGIGKDLGILKVGAPVINARLRAIVAALPGVSDKAERLARR